MDGGREGSGREGGGGEGWGRIVRVSETGKEPSAGMNTESSSRLSHRRMSHLVQHCAVNETERGGTPAERGLWSV